MNRIRITSEYSGDKQVQVYKTEMLTEIAGFAAQLIERWGLVAAMPDGEDSTGRARLRLPTSKELVDRAFEIAEATFATAQTRGHMIQLPDLNEINAEKDAERASKKARGENVFP